MKSKKLYEISDESLIVWESKYILEIEVLRFQNKLSRVSGINQRMRGKNMSKLKKRNLERKGEKKQKNLENRLMEEHLVDLTKTKGELEILSEEEV
jgi:hypothetical protein